MTAELHPRFRLNGHSIGREEIWDVAYSLVKEGEDFEREAGEFLLSWIDHRETVAIRTSGSTGKPKIVELAKASMAHSARETGEFFKLGPGTRALCCLSAGNIAGKMMLVRAMVLGWNLSLIAPDAEPLNAVRGDFDFAALVPLQLKKSLGKLSRIRKIIVGGAPIPTGILAALPGKGTEIWQSYGMTETATHVALRRLKRIDPAKDAEAQLPPFKAMPGIHFKTDRKGCLVVHAPERLQAPVQTNDLVECLSETSFRWLGRWDQVINSGGIKLHPERLEARLGALIESRFFLAGMPDDILGERLVLVVEGSGDPEKLREVITNSDAFESYEVPREVRFVAAMCETTSSKVNRQATLDSLAD